MSSDKDILGGPEKGRLKEELAIIRRPKRCKSLPDRVRSTVSDSLETFSVNRPGLHRLALKMRLK